LIICGRIMNVWHFSKSLQIMLVIGSWRCFIRYFSNLDNRYRLSRCVVNIGRVSWTKPSYVGLQANVASLPARVKLCSNTSRPGPQRANFDDALEQHVHCFHFSKTDIVGLHAPFGHFGVRTI
jgi:hypothetical protein